MPHKLFHSTNLSAHWRSAGHVMGQVHEQAPITLPQVDFAASMALLLGVPIPYGSIGRLSRELWLLSGQPEAAATMHAALSVNAWQARPMSWTMLCQAAIRKGHAKGISGRSL